MSEKKDVFRSMEGCRYKNRKYGAVPINKRNRPVLYILLYLTQFLFSDRPFFRLFDNSPVRVDNYFGLFEAKRDVRVDDAPFHIFH